MLTLDQKVAAKREQMARIMRRMQRIIRLQSSLNIRLQVSRQMYEQTSLELWHLENGYKLSRDASQFTEDQAERATAALIAFDPLRKPAK